MKIFYINVIEENAGFGAECFVNRGFLLNGHETITLDFRVNRYKLSSKFLEVADFDILFLQRGDGFPLELLRAVNRPRFFWASELVSRCRDQDQLLSSGLFEHIFVRTHECIRAIVEKGWLPEEKLSILLSGFDELVQYRIPGVKKDIDVLFVGNVLPRRRRILDRLLKHYNVVEKLAFGKDMTELINRSKVVLNIHSEEFLDTETRVFEVLGCGGFLLTEILSVENPFKSGVHLVEVDGLDEMIEKIGYYLNNEEQREAIAVQGHAEALAKHSYTQRAEEIAAVFHSHVQRVLTPAINQGAVRSYVWTETVQGRVAQTKRDLITIKGKLQKSLGRRK